MKLSKEQIETLGRTARVPYITDIQINHVNKSGGSDSLRFTYKAHGVSRGRLLLHSNGEVVPE